MSNTKITEKLSQSAAAAGALQMRHVLMRSPWKMFPVLAVVLLGFACSNKDSGRGETERGERISSKPNVVLIVADSLRADRLGAERNGVPIMPNLTALAKESVVFSNATTSCTCTKPAMTSIFTSLHVDTHQVYFNGTPEQSDVLPESLETMAVYLKKTAGYTTTGIQTNANLLESLGFAQGFDRYEFLPNTPDADVVTARAIEEADNSTEPFFLYVHYMDTHWPYLPPDKYREIFGWPPAIDKAELKTVLDFNEYRAAWCQFKAGLSQHRPEPLSQAAQEAVKTLYDGEAHFFDEEVAKLVAHLRTLYPNTYIIFLADHGEHLWDHDYLSHGLTLYEEETHVPFVIWGPGIESRQVLRNVQTMDLLPTLANLLDAEPNPTWQGTNLFGAPTTIPFALASRVEAVTGTLDNTKAPVFSRTRWLSPKHNTNLEMVKLGNLKLIWNFRNETAELYDLERDPKANNNLVEERPEVVTVLKALLDKNLERNVRARKERGSKNIQLDPEAIEQLRALGYLPQEAGAEPDNR